jgi:hypothetical protein
MEKNAGSTRPSDLTKGSTAKTSPQLAETDLDKVSGGTAAFLDFGDIKGESTDDKHSGTIAISSFRKP